MIEIFIIFLLLLSLFASFIYFTTNSKDLSIKILNQTQTKKTLEQKIIRLEECIKIKNKTIQDSCQTHHNIIDQKDRSSLTCSISIKKCSPFVSGISLSNLNTDSEKDKSPKEQDKSVSVQLKFDF